MIRFIGDYYGNRYEVSDAAGTAEHFDHCSNGYVPHGVRGQSMYLGRVDSTEELRLDLDGSAVELRIDIDVDAGRAAALRWLPDRSYAVELPPAEMLSVLESESAGLITVPATVARVSPGTARRAVIEYVLTGLRPTGIEWAVHDREWPPGRWGLTDERGLDFSPESEDELVHGLDEIDRAARRDRNPVIALLDSAIDVEGAPYMYLVLGGDDSFIEYETGDEGGERVVGRGPHEGDESTTLARHGAHGFVRYPRWMAIRRDAAYAAAREFYRTRARPTCVEWRDG
ncbi:Imm1 family immunity protein [Actinomadura sp. HBU206391]|uniref:Imm1 family immunity protein n=1 Tax=Actinomadura sp. HBU206391 TaxID=2731692 RepID=UPI001650BBDC|nr:Imm1 family immunity protein [Actinomadura sp. HBU206391]MBC6461072.1 hypothetical protein [Actinomadura sp. HBU206391]